MADPVDLMILDLEEKYAELPTTEAYLRLYPDEARFGRIFANLQERLNTHFEAINGRVNTTKYYWADSSRDLLALIEEVPESLFVLQQAGVEVRFSPEYQAEIERCKPWLANFRGSTVPDDFTPIKVIKYSPVFVRPDATVRLRKNGSNQSLHLVGEGSYAKVFSFEDPDYGIKFALKRAKSDLPERDLYRFREEFRILKSLSHPYLVEVYQYDEARNEYKMEFCDETLRHFIGRRNASLGFDYRKRIALQFLYGINFLHIKGYLHRDVSLQNILLKTFGDDAVLVKLSDFGLVKDTSSTFTRTQTEMRGTIRDPQLHAFKDYSVTNEIYAIGWVLSYIFTGKESLITGRDGVKGIVRKCTDQDTNLRYTNVRSIISDVEQLTTTTGDAPA